MFTKKSVLGEFSAMKLAVAFGIGALLLGAAKQVRADILLTVSSGASTESFDFASNTSAFETLTVGGYGVNVDTVVTNFPGTALLAEISTTVNVTGPVTSSLPLFVTAQLITSGAVAPGGPYPPPAGFDYTAQPLLPWSAPSSGPVLVTAQSNGTVGAITNGTVSTTTYYDSGPAATFAGSTNVISASSVFPPGAVISNSVAKPDTGMFTLSQTIELSGVNLLASGFNFGGTSEVSVPEPGRIVGLFGVAGMMGLGLFWQRRRSAALNV